LGNSFENLISEIRRLTYSDEKAKQLSETLLQKMSSKEARETTGEDALLKAIQGVQRLAVKMDMKLEELSEKASLTEQVSMLTAEFKKLKSTLNEMVAAYMRIYNFVWDIFKFVEKHNDNALSYVEKILEKLEQEMKKVGITVENPKGKKYDTKLHEVVATQEARDLQDEMIVEVLKVGFSYNGEILKKAQVITVLNKGVNSDGGDRH